MISFVLDASTALSWCIPDEMTPDTLDVFDRLRDQSAIVSSMWHLEVANVLVVSLRRKRMTPVDLAAAKSTLGVLKIETDITKQFGIAELLELTQMHLLTAYDATYFELAARTGLPLATRDRRLIAAARNHGISLLL